MLKRQIQLEIICANFPMECPTRNICYCQSSFILVVTAKPIAHPHQFNFGQLIQGTPRVSCRFANKMVQKIQCCRPEQSIPIFLIKRFINFIEISALNPNTAFSCYKDSSVNNSVQVTVEWANREMLNFLIGGVTVLGKKKLLQVKDVSEVCSTYP